jgi:XTP/dITP diphosphohydrolase
MRLCFASNNEHKLREIQAVIGSSFSITSLASIGCTEELPETRDTLSGNALQKAEYVFNRYAIPCFADDTGLEVDALNGAPGVYSARYAGEQRNSNDNIQLLLKNLSQQTNRAAQFRTVIALVGFDKQPLLFEGVCKGEIIRERKGNHGFGYDPVFVPEGFTTTFAEMPLEEKNKLSHRALAIKKLAEYLRTTQFP